MLVFLISSDWFLLEFSIIKYQNIHISFPFASICLIDDLPSFDFPIVSLWVKCISWSTYYFELLTSLSFLIDEFRPLIFNVILRGVCPSSSSCWLFFWLAGLALFGSLHWAWWIPSSLTWLECSPSDYVLPCGLTTETVHLPLMQCSCKYLLQCWHGDWTALVSAYLEMSLSLHQF